MPALPSAPSAAPGAPPSFDFSSLLPFLQKLFNRPPSAHAGRARGGTPNSPDVYTQLSGLHGGGSFLSSLPLILGAAPGIIKAVTTDPGFKARMDQDRQNQPVVPGVTPGTTPPIIPSGTSAATSTPTTPIPPVTPTPSVTPTTSATAVSGNAGGRVNMPTQPGDTGGPVNMPTQPGDTGGHVQYSV